MLPSDQDTHSGAAAIEAYLWATPNSNRVSILLEELRLAYRVRPVNIRQGEQFAAEVLALNPYGKIPIVRIAGRDGALILVESGAILLHLAEEHRRFLPRAGAARAETLGWLMVALTSLGPMSGQAHHWTELAPEKPAAAVRHHVALVERVYRLLEGRLAQMAHLAGEYSIADIAAYPWIARSDWTTLTLDDYPCLKRWRDEVGSRPAVQRGMAVPEGARLE